MLRRNRRTRAILVGVAGLCVSGSGLAGALAAAGAASAAAPAHAGPTSTPAAKRLYQRSIAGLHAQHSVHYFVQSAGGKNVETTTGDAGATVGTKTVRFDEAGVVGTVHFVQIGSALYLEGDQTGLLDVELPTTAASQGAGKWLVVPTTDKAYSVFSSGMTFTSAVSQVSMQPPFRPGRVRRFDGQAATELLVRFKISTTKAVAAQYFVAAKGPPLPLGYQLSEVIDKVKTTGVVRLTGWGEHVTAQAPGNPVSIATLGV